MKQKEAPRPAPNSTVTLDSALSEFASFQSVVVISGDVEPSLSNYLHHYTAQVNNVKAKLS